MNEKVSEGWEKLPPELKNDMLIRVFRELSLVKGNTRLLVLVTNGFLELMINRLIDTKTKNAKKISSNGQSFPYATRLLILNEVGVIPDDTYKVFEWLRKLRNKSAHLPVFELTKNDLKQLSDQKLHDPNEFYTVCVNVIGGFWNSHIDIFAPIFAPGTLGESNITNKAFKSDS